MNVLPQRERTVRPPTIVSVNGTVIPTSAITREVQHHPAGSAAESWRQAAAALVLRALLLEEAETQAIVAEPALDDRGRRETEEEARIRALIEQSVATPAPSEEELRRYYEQNQDKFRAAELVEARHILFAARRDDGAEFAAARGRAAGVAALLKADPDAFADLARAHSDCASAGEGGYLGQLTPDETTAEFADAVAKLAEGEVTAAPVETRYGFHIIRLERRMPARTLPFEAVAGRIADYLSERSRRLATAQFLARLVSRAEITGVTLAGAEALRVF